MTVIIILLVAAVLTALLLFLPVKIELKGTVYNRINASLRLKLLSGLIVWEIDIFKKRPKYIQSDVELPFYSQVELFYNILNVNGLYGEVVKLIGHIRHKVKADKIDVNLKFSSGDDYYTGMICGFFLPLALIASEQPSVDIKFQPDFLDEISINGYFYINTHVQPVQILIPALEFLCSTPFRNCRSVILKYNAG